MHLQLEHLHEINLHSFLQFCTHVLQGEHSHISLLQHLQVILYNTSS
jgi:hypothetical protein